MARHSNRHKANRPRQNIRKDVEFEPKTDGQLDYHEAILDNDLTICDGPAGSGKTTAAVGTALRLMKDEPDKYRKLVLVRPAVVVEGEDIGFLPGDADAKLRPFMMPMLDAAGLFLDRGTIQTLMANGAIEFIPVAHLRGRTLSNCVVIFDEAQNARIGHMKMFLTRLGFNCKAIVEGDITQSDLRGDDKKHNGLKWAIERLQDIDGVAIVEMDGEDIVRSPLVKKIISRLEE